MPNTKSLPETDDLHNLFHQMLKFKHLIETEARQLIYEFPHSQTQTDNLLSLINMMHYVAMRRHAVHNLQSQLAQAGLSSLGRIEPHVLTTIVSVLNILSKATQQETYTARLPDNTIDYQQGYKILKARAQRLFGSKPASRTEYIMVTIPSEAADQSDWFDAMFAAGMNCARINCAHDSVEIWQKMVDQIHAYCRANQVQCPIMMDLAGHKIRTANVLPTPERQDFHKGTLKAPRIFLKDWLLLRGQTTEKGFNFNQFSKPIAVVFNCSYPPVIDKLNLGEMVWIDDGKIGTVVKAITEEGVLLQVTQVGPKGVRLKPEKGLNLPQTDLQLPALSQKDHADLQFICQHADLVALSFAETADDILYLQQQLQHLNRADLPIIAKIETPKAVVNLPKIIATALANNLDFGVMIARGDLAVELGSVQMAETQDALLRLCESAHIPIIWATQVLETLAKKGVVSRPEISDAAMSQRSECVMLNKGPFIFEAVRILSEVLHRMEHTQYKSHTHLPILKW